MPTTISNRDFPDSVWSMILVFLSSLVSLSWSSIYLFFSSPKTVSSSDFFILIKMSVSSDMKVDGDGFDCRWLMFLESSIWCVTWFQREDYSIVNFLHRLGYADGRVPSSLPSYAGGRWSALSLTRVSERRAFIHVVGCVDVFLNGVSSLGAYGPRYF